MEYVSKWVSILTASCSVPTLDVARYAFEPARNHLLADSGHLAASSNDIFGLKWKKAGMGTDDVHHAGLSAAGSLGDIAING